MPILTYKITKLVPIRLSRNEVETNTGWSNSSSTLLNGVQRVHNDGSSSNINAAITEAMTLIDGSKYDTYRIIVITHSDISVANHLWDYNWARTDVNIVNLGYGSVMQYVENFTHHTGGEVYNSLYLNDLVSEEGETGYTELEFIGKDFDEDGIPDIVELYGLKPNGQSIGTYFDNPNTDGDELKDGEEVTFDKQYFSELIKSGNYCYGSSYSGAIKTPYDPTSTTILNPYGQIVYNGEVYDIDVPALRYRNNTYWFEAVYEIVDTKDFHDIDWHTLEYLSGKRDSIMDSPNDGSTPIPGYTFTYKWGYLKDDFRNEEVYNLMGNVGGAVGGIIELVNGAVINSSVTFTFYKTKDNSARKVIITARSTSVKNSFDLYANDIPYSAFIANFGYPLDQAYITTYASNLYNSLTGKPIDNWSTYDIIITVDKKHKSTYGAFAELWIDQYNNVVASPIVYGNDNIQIVKGPSLPLIYLFSNPSVLMEIDLAEKIDLDQDFISLFNKIYEYKHKK